MRLLPVRMRRAALCVMLVTSACGDAPPPPTAPTPAPLVPKPTAEPTFTLSGVITERFSGLPVEGAKVWVWPVTFGQLQRWPPSQMRVTPSDRAGRYVVSGLPSMGTVWVSTAQTWGDVFTAPYVHQCVTTVSVEGDAALSMSISSTNDLAALNASNGPASPDSRVVSGTIFEITANGKQPVENVWVGWEASVMDGAVAETRSDGSGHYRICGVARDSITIFAVQRNGLVVSAAVDAGSDAIVDIELARK